MRPQVGSRKLGLPGGNPADGGAKVQIQVGVGGRAEALTRATVRAPVFLDHPKRATEVWRTRR